MCYTPTEVWNQVQLGWEVLPPSETGVSGPEGTSPSGLINSKLSKSILLLFPIESNDILIMKCHDFLRITAGEKNSKEQQTWKAARNLALGAWRRSREGTESGDARR